MVDIEDIIADARAEEEVKRKPIEKPPVMVSITLEKYEELILKAADLDRLTEAIVDGFSYSDWTHIADVFRALYPNAYESVTELAKLEKKEDKKSEFCDKYCKFPQEWDEEAEGYPLSESKVCENCPLKEV